jgi:hypothetical protein
MSKFLYPIPIKGKRFFSLVENKKRLAAFDSVFLIFLERNTEIYRERFSIGSEKGRKGFRDYR